MPRFDYEILVVACFDTPKYAACFGDSAILWRCAFLLTFLTTGYPKGPLSPCAGALGAWIAPRWPLVAQSTRCASTAAPPRPAPNSRDVKLEVLTIRAPQNCAVGRRGPLWLMSLWPRAGRADTGHSCLLDVALAARTAIGCAGRRPRWPCVAIGVRHTIDYCAPSHWLPRATGTRSRRSRTLVHCGGPERKPASSSTQIQCCPISRCQRNWRPPSRSPSAAVPILHQGAPLLNHSSPEILHDFRLAVHAGRPSARCGR